jgi:succinate dehydrogenase/fumarate reductase flavoprotein subunit
VIYDIIRNSLGSILQKYRESVDTFSTKVYIVCGVRDLIGACQAKRSPLSSRIIATVEVKVCGWESQIKEDFMKRESKEPKAITRGDFLKGVGITGLGAIGLGALAACTPNNPPDGGGSGAPSSGNSGGEVSWDKEVDVLVVGSGTSAYAALVAKGNDVENVLVIEKNALWGGTSATSGGTLWIPLFYAGQEAGMADTREDALTYMKLCAGGRGNEKAIEAYIDNGNALLEWTRDTFNWEWTSGPPDAGFKDYYEPYEGFRPWGREADFAGGGAGEWATIQAQLEDMGVEIMMETPATDLIVDESGAVVGVTATSAGKAINIKANTCVILGTGGFDHNAELGRAYQAIPIYNSLAVQTNTGDGLLMGQAIGAATANLDSNWGLPSFINEPFDANANPIYNMLWGDWGINRTGAGSLIVNLKGKRFANESSAYPVFNRAFANYDTAAPGYENIPAVFICDSGYATSAPLVGQGAIGDPVPENFFQADTLAEIAEHFGIDAATLEAEVAAFNANAANGVDPVFKRGDKHIDRSIAAYRPYKTELANPCLAPVATPPFYASLYVPGTCGTSGGLKTNEKAQVLNTKGEPIKGLYAVGNCMAGITGGQYCGAGLTVGQGAVFSWIAVRDALGIA